MIEEQIQETAQEAANAQQQTDVTLSQNLQNAIWGDAPQNNQQQQQAETLTQAQEQQPEPTKEEEEIITPEDWLQREFGTNDPASIKQQIEEYNKLKDQKPEEIKFANEESKKAFEYLREGKIKELKEILDRKETLETYTSGEVNKDNAENIIKTSMKYKNEYLTDDEIKFQYNQEFGTPKQPVQKLTESDEEFQERMTEWEEKVQTIEMKKVVAAKMAIPDLQKLKSEIVLPDISPKNNQQAQPTQEELEQVAKLKESFLKEALAAVNEFDGFNVTVKDKDVEIPVAYNLSSDEKKFISDKIAAFTESGFNTNALFADEWVNENGTVNTKKMTEDLSRMYFGEKAYNKFANESAAQRLEMYLKDKKNINLKNIQQSTPDLNDQKTQSQHLQEQFWGN